MKNKTNKKTEKEKLTNLETLGKGIKIWYSERQQMKQKRIIVYRRISRY